MIQAVDQKEHWRVYHAPSVLEAADRIREIHAFPSTGVWV